MDEPERETEADNADNPSGAVAPLGVNEEPVSPAEATPEESTEPTPTSTPALPVIQSLPISVPVIHSLGDKKPPLDEMHAQEVNATKEQHSSTEDELPVGKMTSDAVKHEPEPASSPSPPTHEDSKESPEQQQPVYVKSEQQPLNLNQEIPQSVPCNLSATMASAPPSTSTAPSFVGQQQLAQPTVLSIPPPSIAPPTSLQYPGKFEREFFFFFEVMS